MIPILQELKALMEVHGLSIGGISKLIGVSEKTAYNWLSYESSSPRAIYHPRIKKAIQKIRKEYEGEPINLEINRYYQAVWPGLTRKEKDGLLEIVSQSGGVPRPEYLEKLKALAAVHKIKVEGPKKEKT